MLLYPPLQRLAPPLPWRCRPWSITMAMDELHTLGSRGKANTWPAQASRACPPHLPEGVAAAAGARGGSFHVFVPPPLPATWPQVELPTGEVVTVDGTGSSGGSGGPGRRRGQVIDVEYREIK